MAKTKTAKPAADPAARAAEIRARLEAAGAFSVQAIAREPATDAALDEAERRLGVTFPPGLRRLYASGANLYWTISDEEALAYEEGSAPMGGQLELVRLENLKASSAGVRFTNDGAGNGFCLAAKAGGGEAPIVFWEHDDGTVRPFAKGFDAFFEKWAALGFAIDHASDGDYEPVTRYLRTGKLPKRKAAKVSLITGRASPLPKELRPLHADTQVYAMTLTPDDERALVGGYGGVLRVVDVAKNGLVREIPLPSFLYGVAASADGRRAVCVGEGFAQMVDLEGGAAGVRFGTGGQRAVAMSQDGAVIVGGGDGALACYDAASGAERWRAQPFTMPVAWLELDGAGRAVAHAFDKAAAAVVVHDVASGAELGRLEGAPLRPGVGVGLSADRSALLVPTGRARVARLSLPDLRAPGEGAAATAAEDAPLCFKLAAIDGRCVLVGLTDRFEVWDLESASTLRAVEIQNGGVPSAIRVRADRRSAVLASYLGWMASWRLE